MSDRGEEVRHLLAVARALHQRYDLRPFPVKELRMVDKTAFPLAIFENDERHAFRLTGYNLGMTYREYLIALLLPQVYARWACDDGEPKVVRSLVAEEVWYQVDAMLKEIQEREGRTT